MAHAPLHVIVLEKTRARARAAAHHDALEPLAQLARHILTHAHHRRLYTFFEHAGGAAQRHRHVKSNDVAQLADVGPLSPNASGGVRRKNPVYKFRLIGCGELCGTAAAWPSDARDAFFFCVT